MHKIYITLTIALGFILAIGFQYNKISALELTIATMKSDLAKANADAALAQLNKEAEIQTIKDASYDQIQELQEQLVDTSNSRDALLKRLRNISSTAHCPATQAAETAKRSQSKQDQATFDLFVGMLDRHTRELEEIGGYADKLRLAGLMCENIGDKWAE